MADIQQPIESNIFGTMLSGTDLDSRYDDRPYNDLPLVYSCSGCSSAAQMANDLAVRLDREQVAEMSCIAGVGGNVGPLVETATADRPTLVIDGCPLECAKKSLEQHDVTPTRHINPAKKGVTKEYHTDYDDKQAAQLYDELVDEVVSMEAAI